MSSSSSGPVASILDVIGDTPLLRIDGIWAKLEFLNPSGSIRVELVGDFHLNEALRRADALGRRPGYFCPRQFESECNIEENRRGSAPRSSTRCPTARCRTRW
jgi:cysteine synthase A